RTCDFLCRRKAHRRGQHVARRADRAASVNATGIQACHTMTDPTTHSDRGAKPSMDALEAPEYFANILSAVRERHHPTQIGPYFIQELIGEGGMGSVYKAEQREPIRRTVAIKIIKLGMDTRQVIARFESERQALALMDHPNVARVIDAGATETGRPYFVMEYVVGATITTFCDRQQYTIQQRLEL